MGDKMDPKLLELLEDASVEPARQLELMVALTSDIDDAIRAELLARGLRIRSELGTILTGSAPVENLARVSDSPHVLKLELSAPMYRERGEG